MNKFSSPQQANELPEIKVWELRRIRVMEIIKKFAIESMLDLGCGEGKLISYLLGLELGLNKIFGVDIDENALKYAEEIIRKTIKSLKLSNIYEKNLSHSKIELSLYKHSLIEVNSFFKKKFLNLDLISFIEVIEHLQLSEANIILEQILGEYKPKFMIVTTPNKDYNHVYGMKDQDMRHWDHKFEWTRKEFFINCKKAAESQEYEMIIDGVGPFLEGSGHCTQTCLFIRKQSSFYSLTTKINKSIVMPFYSKTINPVRKMNNNRLAFEIINSYNYFSQKKNSCGFISLYDIFSYCPLSKLFSSFEEFVIALSKLEYEKYFLKFSSSEGILYEPEELSVEEQSF